MLAAANGANHVGEYPEGKYCPMPNKVGTIHAVCDLREILELRAQLENICLMHTEAVVKAEKLQAQVENILKGDLTPEQYHRLMQSEFFTNVKAHVGKLGWLACLKHIGYTQKEWLDDAEQYANQIRQQAKPGAA